MLKSAPKKSLSEEAVGIFYRKVSKLFLTAFSRPDKDGETLKLIQYLKQKFSHKISYHKVLMELTQKSISALTNEERSPVERATYLYALENILNDLKLDSSSKGSQMVLNYFVSAHIEVPEEVHSERYMRILEPKTLSPSTQAHYILTNQVDEEDDKL